MADVRTITSTLMTKGVVSPAWYSILTGLGMLLLVWILGPAYPTDSAAPVVGVVLAVVGLWLLERGVRSEVRRRRRG